MKRNLTMIFMMVVCFIILLCSICYAISMDNIIPDGGLDTGEAYYSSRTYIFHKIETMHVISMISMIIGIVNFVIVTIEMRILVNSKKKKEKIDEK